MLSMYCTASMLPCGRYYYAPEGGYVGNPWVKFSYQYAYLYMAWILHHLDLIEHYGFQYVQHLMRRHSNLKLYANARKFPKWSSNYYLPRFARSRILRLRASGAYADASILNKASKSEIR